MKNLMMAFAAMFSIAAGTACGPAPEKTEAPEDNNTGGVHAQVCGDRGYFTCPTDGKTFGYKAAGCGTPASLYYDNVYTKCEQYCSVSCEDSGWISE
ncbi:hypothetical protein F0U60_22970 [Archangium minus]|uniref:Lipoprotein n=1 Tax=Archangium minus TaxID=83450 RepID=A0ABY9WU16_9BACT|nr:hypothetical protein F0U60_22970 [Archangium minus]